MHLKFNLVVGGIKKGWIRIRTEIAFNYIKKSSKRYIFGKWTRKIIH